MQGMCTQKITIYSDVKALEGVRQSKHRQIDLRVTYKISQVHFASGNQATTGTQA